MKSAQIELVHGSLRAWGPGQRCCFRIAPRAARRLVDAVVVRRRLAIPGFRLGQAPLRIVLQHQRRPAEAALCRAVQEFARQLPGLLDTALTPPQYTVAGLSADQSCNIEARWFVQPAAPDPLGRAGQLAGATLPAAPRLPQPAASGYQELLPQAVRHLPQLQHLRLGGTGLPSTARRGASALVPSGRTSAAPPRPALPIAPAPAGSPGAPRAPQPERAAHPAALSVRSGSTAPVDALSVPRGGTS